MPKKIRTAVPNLREAGEQGTGQVMKAMKVTDVYSSINYIKIGVDFLRNHMIEDWGDRPEL